MIVKQFICKLAVAAAILVAPLSTHVLAQEKYDLSLSLFSPSANAANETLLDWANDLREKSDGRLNIQFFPMGQMGPPPRQFDLARTGTADMAWLIHGFTPGRFPMTEVAYLPGLFKSSEEGSPVLMEAVPEYLAEEHTGVKVLAITYSTPLVLFTIEDEINEPADLDGMRIRHPGAPIADTIRAFGGAPVAVPPPEMSEALSRRVVDGIATNYEAAHGWSFLNELNYVSDPGIGSVTLGLVINQKSYDSLPDDLQTLIDETSGVPLSLKLGQAFDATEAEAKKNATNITETKISDEAQQAFDKIYEESIEQRLSADDRKREFYNYLRSKAQE